MKIYNSEVDLQKLIKQSKTCACVTAPIKITEPKHELFAKSLSSKDLSKDITKVIAQICDQEHPDLMYGSAILVSTIMNANDDVFLPDETWKAVSSAINQPFNDDHIEYDIIGHIIASKVVDKEGNDVISDTPPSYFDVSVDFVVYKSIFPKVSAEIATKGPEGQKFVSMEARFKSFDFALVDADGNMKIVARNEETAFLTKYLRAYGGNGLYNNYKIGRVLRDFRFVGMGSVDNPANPTSEFTRIENYSSDANFAKELISLNKTEVKQMDELQKALAEIEALKTELASVKAEKDAKASEITNLTEKLNVATTKSEVAEQKATEFTNKVTELTQALEATQADLTTYKSQIEEINKNTKANERFAKLAELKLELKDEQKAKIKDMSDESFASVLEFSTEIANKATASTSTVIAEEENKAKEELDNAEEKKEGDLPSNAGEVPDPAAEMQLVAACLVENLRKNRKNSRNIKK